MKKSLSVFLMSICFISFVFFSACKEEEEDVYDIRGEWILNFYVVAANIQPPGTATITFTGSLTSGTFVDSAGGAGTYTVNDMAVEWTYPSGTVYSGNFDSTTTMSGTWQMPEGYTGPWDATKM